MLRILVISIGAICMLAAFLLSIVIVIRHDLLIVRFGGLLWIAGPILILIGRRIRSSA